MAKFLIRLPEDVDRKADALAELDKQKQGLVEPNKSQTIRTAIMERYDRAVEAGEIIEQE